MGIDLPSHWFTAVRIRRIGQVLQRVPGARPGISKRNAVRAAWSVCGGSFTEVETLLDVLLDLALVTAHDETYNRTASGNKIVRNLRRGDLTPIVIVLIRDGRFHDQARVLLENGEFDSDDNLVCSRKTAEGSAPQLVAALDLWSEVRTRPHLFVPKHLIAELDTVWSLLPPKPEVPEWALERKRVGDRAEMYSVQFERARVGRSSIAWVARDSDSFGYDVEDRSVNPFRCIEVKGRRDRKKIFFLTANEMSKAEDFGSRYELHFWGAIDLRRDPWEEYQQLRSEGYPLVIPHLASAIAGGEWQATPTEFRIERKL